MNSLRRVLGNTGVSLLGQLVTWASTLAVVAAYGRFLDDTQFGALYFATSFIALIGFPVEFGFNQQIVRDVARRPEQAARYPANILILKVALWGGLFGVSMLLSVLLRFDSVERMLIALAGCTLLVSAVGSAFASIHTAVQRQVFPAVGIMIEKGLGAGIAILWLRQGGGVEAAALALLLGASVGALWQAFWFLRLVGRHWSLDLGLIRDLVRQSIPFLIYGALGVIYYRIDTMLLEALTSTAVVGVYGAAYRLFDTLVFLPNIVIMAVMYPLMANFAAKPDARLNLAIEKSVNFLLVAGAPIMVGLIVAAPNIIGFLYHRSDYIASVPVLQALAPGLFLLYLNSVWTTALMSLKFEKRLPLIAGVALVFNVVANLLLIPRLGAVGAAIITSLTELLLAALTISLLPRHLLPVRSLITGVKALVASLGIAVSVGALSRFSLLVIIPVAAVVYGLVATILGTIPRADLLAISSAIGRRSQGAAPNAETSEGGMLTYPAFPGAKQTHDGAPLRARWPFGYSALTVVPRLLRGLPAFHIVSTGWKLRSAAQADHAYAGGADLGDTEVAKAIQSPDTTQLVWGHSAHPTDKKRTFADRFSFVGRLREMRANVQAALRRTRAFLYLLVRRAATQMRIFAASLIKYTTNHIIASVPSYTLRYAWYQRVLGWQIEQRTTILMGQYIQMTGIRTSGRRVSIGVGTVINQRCLIYTSGGLVIGDHVSISPEVALVTGAHDIDHPDFPSEYQPIVIDDYAWIGARAVILRGVTIGQGAVVMAGAVVTKDVEPYTVVGGVPAKPISKRNLRAPSYELMARPLFE